MALVTTFMTGPLLDLVEARKRKEALEESMASI
jgi:hypothetical protein